MPTHPPIVVFDLETTGLDPERQEIIEIGAVKVSHDLNSEIEEFHAKIKPQHIETAMPEALQVNGYSDELWADAGPLSEVLPDFLKFINGSMLAAYNNTLDMRFLLSNVAREKLAMTSGYHYIDIFSIAYEHVVGRQGKDEMLRLSDMCAYFGIPTPPEPHQALDDAHAALNVWRMVRAAL